MKNHKRIKTIVSFVFLEMKQQQEYIRAMVNTGGRFSHVGDGHQPNRRDLYNNHKDSGFEMEFNGTDDRDVMSLDHGKYGILFGILRPVFPKKKHICWLDH